MEPREVLRALSGTAFVRFHKMHRWSPGRGRLAMMRQGAQSLQSD
jgi:hypothetical protein